MITKQIIDQYNGKIWVDSEPGVGSTFSLKLKLIEEDQLQQIEVVPKYNYQFLWQPDDNSVVKYVHDFDKKEDFICNLDLEENSIDMFMMEDTIQHQINRTAVR